MNNHKNRGNSFHDIQIINLKLKDVESYLKIEFDAFYEKLKIMFSNKKEAALNIIRTEISRNIDTGRYYNAKAGGRIVGIIEIVTKENTRRYIKDFRVYFKYLGLTRAVKAILLNFFEVPKLDDGTIYIDNVAVDADNRRKGVANKMLSFTEDYARRHGKDTLTLWVAGANKNAYSLYKKFGFCNVVARSSGIAEKFSGYREWIYMKKEIPGPL